MKLTLAPLLVGLAVLAATQVRAEGLSSPKTRWTFQTAGPIRGSAVVVDDHIYFGSADGHLYAAHKSDGSLLWKFQTGGAIAGAPAVAGSTVIVAGRGDYIHALDAATGAPRWSFQMQPIVPAETAWDYFTATPVVDNDQVLVGSGDGHLYALDLAAGKLRWKFKTGDRIRATPLVVGDTVYQPSGDDHVYAISAATGSLQWKYATEGTGLERGLSFMRSDIFTRPSLQDGLLVFGSRDSNVYAIDSVTHEKRWSFTYDSTWAMSTTVDAGTVYVGWSTNNMICALDLGTGEKKWEFKAGAHTYTTALIVGDDTYWGSADGKIYNLDKSTGVKKWAYDIGSEVYSSLAHDSGTLYVGADDGRLYAIADGPAAHKAFYLPTEIPANGGYLIVDEAIVPYLTERGFEQLDSTAALADFVSARTADGAPSVIVFAYAHIPQPVLGEDPAAGPLRAYLESGGKVVWSWGVANLHSFDETGKYLGRDPSHAARLLEIDFVKLEDSGGYYSRPTQAGRNWGFPAWFKTTFASVAPTNDFTPLAVDEYGRVSVWLKRFHPRPGSGWVSFRTWGFNVPIRDDDLALIAEAASYGLD